MKRLAPLAAGLLSALVLTGCSINIGGGGDDLGKQFATFFQDSRPLVADVDIGLAPATKFRPARLALARSSAQELDAVAFGAGLEVDSAGAKLQTGTTLSEEEAKNVACFMFEKGVEGELSTDLDVLEEQAAEYIGARFIEGADFSEFYLGLEKLAEAIETMRGEDEESMGAAVATACDAF